MKKIILLLVLNLAAMPLVPRPAAAADCALGYARCISESYDLDGALESMADLECGAAYVGCIGSKLKFW